MTYHAVFHLKKKVHNLNLLFVSHPEPYILSTNNTMQSMATENS